MDSEKVAGYFAQLRKTTHRIDSLILEIQRKGNGLQAKQPYSTLEQLHKDMDKFKDDIEDTLQTTKQLGDSLELAIAHSKHHLATCRPLLEEAYDKVKKFVVEEPKDKNPSTASDDIPDPEGPAPSPPLSEMPTTLLLQAHQSHTGSEMNRIATPDNIRNNTPEVMQTPCLLDCYPLEHQLKILDLPATHITKSGSKIASNKNFKHVAAKREYSEKKSKRALSIDPTTPLTSTYDSTLNISPMVTPTLNLSEILKKTPVRSRPNFCDYEKYRDRIAPVQVEEYFRYSHSIKDVLTRTKLNSIIESINTMFSTMEWKPVREDELKELIRAEVGPVTNILLVVLKRLCRVKADPDNRGYIVPMFGIPAELPPTSVKKVVRDY